MEIFSPPPEAAVKRLLAECGLPTADITAEHLKHFFGLGTPQALVGVVGIEPCGEAALLRSLAVSAPLRGRGWGGRLLARAEEYAGRCGIRALYLLTTTAEEFFRRRGYRRIPREAAPGEVAATREFAAICPASSACMVKELPAA